MHKGSKASIDLLLKIKFYNSKYTGIPNEVLKVYM